MSESEREDDSVFLTARWRMLLMLNFAVESGLLAPHVPMGTEIDDWNGTPFISLVAFRFLDTRVKGMAVPFHRNFDEINLRFYVRARGPDGRRRGVVFIREVVPRRAIAAAARWLYNENYVACPTRSTITEPSADAAGYLEYGWRHAGEWLSIEARFAGSPIVPEDGSQEQFITDHNWGYSLQRDGGTMEYRVEHPRWKVWAATESRVTGDLAGFYGSAFATILASRPYSAFVADGSPVSVRTGRLIDDTEEER